MLTISLFSVVGCLCMICVYFVHKHNKQRKKASITLLKSASYALQNDEKLQRLHNRMMSLPKDGTQMRQNQRSHVIRDILSVTNDIEMTKAICALADMKSKKALEEK